MALSRGDGAAGLVDCGQQGSGTRALAIYRRPDCFALEKSLAGTGALETSLYSEEQGLPIAATTKNWTSGANDAAPEAFPTDSICSVPYTDTDPVVIIVPDDVAYAYGQATLGRVCGAPSECS